MMNMETKGKGSVSELPAAEKSTGKMKHREDFGSITIVFTFICVQILCYSSVQAQPTTIRPTTIPCSRLLMKGIDNDNLPWLQMAGIYHLVNFTVDLFPVYKHESIDTYFYYNRSMKELRFGQPYQNTTILVGAFTNGRTDNVKDYYTPPFNAFYYMITGWYQFDPASLQHVALAGDKEAIEPTCLPNHVATCLSGMVELDDNLKQIHPTTRVITDVNILGLDYYKQLPGLYINRRPVYTRMRGDVDTKFYLYYTDGLWLFGPDYTSTLAVMRVSGSAVRPEHVLGTWELYTNGRFSQVEAKVRCRALTIDKSCDASPANHCLNGGTCLTSTDGLKKYCGCAPGYRGLYCEEQIPSCSQPTELITLLNTIEGDHPYFRTSLLEGSVLTIFRSLGLRPSYWFSTCNGSSWSTTSITILQPTTTSTTTTSNTPLSTRTVATSTTTEPTTTTYRYYDYTTRRYIIEWDDTAAGCVLLVMVMIMQILNPLIIFCIIKCVTCARVKKADEEDDAEAQNLYRNYQITLDVFRQQHPQPEEEYDAVTAAQLSKIHNDYQKSTTEINERKEERNQKSKGKVKFYRLLSLYANITFWIFLFYLILYSTPRLLGGFVFVILFLISAVFIFVSYLIVLLEYLWSAERQYISNLSSSVFALERIEAIRAARPSIFLQAEFYHYETRTRTVTYTDVNGRLQTRLETYQEKVVTNLILEPVSFQYWKDTSPSELIGIRDKAITKIKMTLSVEPGDEETTTAIFEQYNAFQATCIRTDTFVDFSIEKRVTGFEKRLAAYTDNRGKPIWVSSAYYMAATFLCLNWPYRWAFNSICSKTEFPVSKLFYLNRPVEDNVASEDIKSYVKTADNDCSAVNIDSDQTSAPTSQYLGPPPYAPDCSSETVSNCLNAAAMTPGGHPEN